MDFLQSIYIPVLGGNWVDLAILAILIFFLVEGILDRFIPAALNLFGFILTYTSALLFYTFAAQFFVAKFSLPYGIANALGFFAVAVITEGVYNIISIFIYRAIPLSVRVSAFNKFMGFVPAIGNGVILIAFILTLIVILPTTPTVKRDILDSKIGSILVLRTQTIEGTINKVFGQAVNESLTFLTVHPSSQNKDSVDLKFHTSAVTEDEESEKRMLMLVNQERKKEGLKELSADTNLQKLSRAYATDMFERGYFSHYNPEEESPFRRMEKAGIDYEAAGENLAYAPDVEVAHSGLMNSPGHRANILSKDFGHVGIGVIDGGIYGKMFVQEFSD